MKNENGNKSQAHGAPGAGGAAPAGRYDMSQLVGTAAVSLFVGAVIGHTFAGRAQAPSPPPSRTAAPAYQAVSAAPAGLEAAVLRVASNFECPCGNCGPDRLDMCDCDMPKGSVEVKGFIRAALGAGKSEPEVIAMVESTYGHRIKAGLDFLGGR